MYYRDGKNHGPHCKGCLGCRSVTRGNLLVGISLLPFLPPNLFLHHLSDGILDVGSAVDRRAGSEKAMDDFFFSIFFPLTCQGYHQKYSSTFFDDSGEQMTY